MALDRAQYNYIITLYTHNFYDALFLILYKYFENKNPLFIIEHYEK